jgi:hypothetical protein
MTIDEFKTLAEAWGGDIARWPPHLRAAAQALAQTPIGMSALDEAQRLDRLIATATPEIDAERINRALFNVATAIAAADRPPPRSRVARWWLVPAASFAGAAVVGISLGIMHPLSSLRHSADATSVLSIILGDDSIETSWVGR